MLLFVELASDKKKFPACSLVDMYAKCGAIKEAYAVSCDIERIGCCLVECDDF